MPSKKINTGLGAVCPAGLGMLFLTWQGSVILSERGELLELKLTNEIEEKPIRNWHSPSLALPDATVLGALAVASICVMMDLDPNKGPKCCRAAGCTPELVIAAGGCQLFLAPGQNLTKLRISA